MIRQSFIRHRGGPPWLVLAVLALGIGSVPAHGQRDELYALPDLARLERTFVELAANVRPVVVSIQTSIDIGRYRRSRLHSQGSGFVYRADGHIVTNHHVIDGADQITVVLSNGRQYEARIVQFDPRSDLAMIKINAQNLRVATLANLSDVRQGQWAFTVGNPFGVANEDGNTSFSQGVVSAIGRSLTNHFYGDGNDRFYGNLIETSASINPGNSGGPLFSLQGQVIGVNTAMLSSSGVHEGMGYAIPFTRHTRRILDVLATGQVVHYGYLGVTISTPSEAEARRLGSRFTRGARIDEVTGVPDRSPAARAGLRSGDLVAKFDGELIRNRDHLIRAVGGTPVGSEVELVYYRDGRKQTTRVELAERVTTADARVRSLEPDDAIETVTWRGVTLVEPTDLLLRMYNASRDDAGVFVMAVPRDSVLYRRGLRDEMLIVKVDGKRVRTLDEFKNQARAGGNPLRLTTSTGKTIAVPK